MLTCLPLLCSHTQLERLGKAAARGEPAAMSMTALLLSFSLGFVSGLRTFTPLAALFIRRGSVWGYVLAVLAIAEYVMDARPDTPSRTAPTGLAARAISGAIVGWTIAEMHGGSGILGALAGIVGAMIGAYGGHAARLAAIERIGAYPAAFVGDLIAIGLAAFIVTR
jgi:uncharacterized membrane protein